MEKEEEIDFHLLQSVEANPDLTQRSLAHELGLSLRMTNTFVKRLCKKGYLKISTMPGHRFKYFLTPSGLKRKAILSYAFITHSLRFFKQARARCNDVFAALKAQGVDTVAFIGAGDLAEIAFLSLQAHGIALVAILDDQRIGERFLDKKVLPETMTTEVQADRFVYTGQTWPSDPGYHGDMPIIQIFE